MPSDRGMYYRDAGVDIEAANHAKELIKEHARATFNPQVLRDIGHFGAFYKLDQRQGRVLVASTDGVGTKLRVASLMQRYDTVGIDLVNHCVNDIFVGGATPIFFLDYIAMGKLDSNTVEALVKGMVWACRQVGCALIGGETAQMPGVYAPEDLDLAGFIVGVVEEEAIIDGSRVVEGDLLLGLPSSGLHTNGYSLARRAFRLEENSSLLGVYYPELGRTLGEALLETHRCYFHLLQAHLPRIKGMAHITGGGLEGNIPRILPPGLAVSIRKGSWPVPPLFPLIQKAGGVPEEEMYRVFNMGLGMVVIISPQDADALRRELPEAWIVGEVVRQYDQRRAHLLDGGKLR